LTQKTTESGGSSVCPWKAAYTSWVSFYGFAENDGRKTDMRIEIYWEDGKNGDGAEDVPNHHFNVSPSQCNTGGEGGKVHFSLSRIRKPR
jgi:hypothetical protein